MAQVDHIYYAETETPLGLITVARTKEGLCWLDFNQGELALRDLEVWVVKHFPPHTFLEKGEQSLQDVSKQLKEYFSGVRKEFDLPLVLLGTSFQKQVWNVLRDIPYGEVRSYKEVAQVLGSPHAVRAVGGANNRNPIPIVIPCHRVIGADGSLVGYGGGLAIKEQLLALETYTVQTVSKS